MARGVDSDYISSLSLMDGFDMSISFDGFGENMKKFMELPIKYLDSAHDKAVGIVEDIHAMISAPFPDDELPNKGHGTLKDPSSDNVITGSSPTSVEMEQVNPNEEFSSSPTSLITAEDSSLSSVDTDARQTKSVSSKSPDSCASEGIISLERTDGIKEEVILCNSENLSGSCTPENLISLGRTASIEEEIILWNPGNSVKPPQPPDVHVLTEPGNIVQDYVSQEVNTDKVMDQVEHVMCSSLSLRGHAGESSACYGAILLGKICANGEEQSELYSANSPENPTENGNIMDLAGGTISHYLNADVFNGADGLNMFTDDTTYTVDIDLHDGQERMKNNKAEASSVTQPKNTSFKKILMRSLSNKLRWSKKDMNVHQAVPIRPQKAVNVPYEVVSSTDNLEDDWELL